MHFMILMILVCQVSGWLMERCRSLPFTLMFLLILRAFQSIVVEQTNNNKIKGIKEGATNT